MVFTRSTKTVQPVHRLGSQMVYIYTDLDDYKQNMPIQVHRNVILKSSKFFKNALEGPFKESNGIVQIQDQAKQHLETYIEYLYFGSINPPFDNMEIGLTRFSQLFELYVLSDMLQDDKFANAVMDTMLKETDAAAAWPTDLATSAWEQLPVTSPMRKYIVDIWVARSYSEWYGESSGDIVNAPKEFWIEVAKAYTLVREKKDKPLKPCYANRCRYHAHEDALVCS